MLFYLHHYHSSTFKQPMRSFLFPSIDQILQETEPMLPSPDWNHAIWFMLHSSWLVLLQQNTSKCYSSLHKLYLDERVALSRKMPWRHVFFPYTLNMSFSFLRWKGKKNTFCCLGRHPFEVYIQYHLGTFNSCNNKMFCNCYINLFEWMTWENNKKVHFSRNKNIPIECFRLIKITRTFLDEKWQHYSKVHWQHHNQGSLHGHKEP